MSLHVVQLGPIPPPEGGISRNILAIRSELLARGDGCSVVATSKSTTTHHDPNYYYPRTPAALLKLLGSLDFDVLHLHIGGDLSRRVLMMAAAVALLGRGRSVLTVHSGEFSRTEAAKAAKANSLMGRVFRGFSRLVAVNDELAEVLERFRVPREKISVITPFSPRLPDASVKMPTELKAFCDLLARPLVWIGGMERDYDPHTAIKAFQELTKTNSDVGLLMIGGGSMYDEMKAVVTEVGLDANIYLAGNVDHAVTLHLMKNADAVLRTTLFDGDAISIREALFLGTPVIATDTGARPEGCTLVPIGNETVLAAAIENVLRDERSETAAGVPDNRNTQRILDIYDDLAFQRANR